VLGDFNIKVGREDIFKPTTGNKSLHKISNDNGVRVVNIAILKNVNVKSTMFPHRRMAVDIATITLPEKDQAHMRQWQITSRN
jgi:hypothetical protein